MVELFAAPATVPLMQHLTPLEQIQHLDLGDIVKLPDGRELTIRACERALNPSVGTMRGWLLAGEIGPQATLLSIPTAPHDPVVVYTPLADIPPHARAARCMAEGVVSYWAPHLPNISGAMGELAYKVCSLRAAPDPMVLVWRGRELVVFVKSAITTAEELRCWFLGRNPTETEREVTRFGSVVRQPGHARPTSPATPAQQPSRIPFLPGRRR